VCGSDLHIYRGRVAIEPGFIIGHEYVGEVVAAGETVRTVAVGDRVLGTFQTACGSCWFCRHGLFHKCDESRTFGHGATLGSLQGSQAELVLVPHADLALRRVPGGMSDEVALFAGDVMGTGFHAALDVRSGDTVAVIGLGPEDRLQMAGAFGATPVHVTDGSPRDEVRRLTSGRGVDVAIEAVGDPRALDMAIRLARKAGTLSIVGVYAERTEVHMGLAWLKSLTITGGQANVIGHVDRVLGLLAAGRLDPAPLVTHHMSLAEAPDAYALYARREALKIVMTP
jgi:2-desacetyl-2-hydroxyethyl bacteriochlorophyllide A dehydrogenase